MAAGKQYEVVVGMDHRHRQEPGEVYDGPAKSVPWLLEQGAIRELGKAAKAEQGEGGDA